MIFIVSIIGKVYKLFVFYFCCYISLVCFVFIICIIGIFLNENFKYMILKGSLRVEFEYNFIDFKYSNMICINKYNLYVRL